MARNKTAQGGISLRRKVTAWLAAILLVTMLSTGIATMAGQWTVHSFDTLLADNAVCYTVQNALKDEAQAFARYVRQPTSETDVYKRQPLRMGCICYYGRCGLRSLWAAVLRSHQKKHLPPFSPIPLSVSYTHLDVYKRQARVRSVCSLRLRKVASFSDRLSR